MTRSRLLRMTCDLATKRASGLFRLIIVSACSKSSNVPAAKDWISIPKACLTASISFSVCFCCCALGQRSATRDMFGKLSLSSSSLLACSSESRLVSPVKLPPGFARPATSGPLCFSPQDVDSVGSTTMPGITTGIVRMASCAARLVARPAT